ncbi:hypothetical protein SASPL_113222 [Salvia splendens]|uniref:Uncharacterized protein n=1 Tax=Salvia splendens TaxID=180675 RepID=A0A8X8XYK4_SALSN|nr:hypothetical protein SASPL_113222 [Salvia splendens]
MGDDDNEINYFSKSYLFLRAEAATWFDCFRILHSNDLENTDICNTPIEEDGVAGIRYRWIVFISLLFQKAFLYLKKPVAAIGAAVELFPNYPAFNGGCRRFFFNIITGRLVKPDKRSEKFTSMVGNIDKRWDLKRHYYGNKALPIIAIMASKLSYENELFAQNIVTHHWQVLEEELDEDYFSLLYVLPKVLSAFYELIRGFILPWTRGEEYKQRRMVNEIV